MILQYNQPLVKEILTIISITLFDRPTLFYACLCDLFIR